MEWGIRLGGIFPARIFWRSFRTHRSAIVQQRRGLGEAANEGRDTTLGKTRILMVEHELIIAEDIRVTLEEKGYEVIGNVLAPEQAIVKCREGLPDLILMDICLGNETDGIEFACAIKAEFGIPVVHLTGWPENWLPESTSSQEPNLYVKKPFSEAVLCAVIEAALKNRRRNPR